MGVWINMSGGSTKGAGIAGQVTTLLETFKVVPVGITGVSIGAALALPLLLGKYKLVKQLITTITLEDIFDNVPITKKGNISFKAILRIIKSIFTNKVAALGTQNNFFTLYQTVITEQEFKEYKKSNLAVIYVGVVNINTGLVEFRNIKKLDYTNFLKCIMASTSIPIATELVEIEANKFYTDGGVAAHIGSKFVVDNFKNVTKIINCFSRPKNIQVKHFINSRKDIEIVNTLLQVLDIQTKNNSKLIEDYVDLYCSNNNIKNINLYLPNLLTNVYDTDPVKLLTLYNEGVLEALNKYA